MPETDAIYVARQPILDRRGRTAGYELLYRASAAASTAEFPDQRTACLRTLINVFMDLGPETLLGSRLGFLNVTGDVLRSEVVEALPKDRFVLEVLENDVVDGDLRRRCRELRKRGFVLALDDYVPGDERAALLPEVEFVKVDLMGTAPSSLRRLVHELRAYPVRLLAEKVETREEHERCRELGFDLFQGYHFAKPITLAGRAVDPARAALLDLMRMLRQGAELDCLEDHFKAHASLGVNLLRLVNSVALARSQRISTVRQALVLIGRRRLERWLVMLLFAGQQRHGNASPLLQTAALRGRVMELLAARALAGEAGAYDGEPGDRAFLVGMLSLVDAVLGMSKEEVLDRLRVDEAIRGAVLAHTPVLGRLLSLTEQLEQGDFAGVTGTLGALGLTPEDLFAAQVEAAGWVQRVEDAGAADD